jgi:D-alanyl-D-alanine carboxypeptidase
MHKRIPLVIIGIVLLIVAALWVRHAAAPSHTAAPQTATASIAKPATQAPSFDKSKYSLTDPSSPWVIVNKQHPVTPQTYAPSDLVSVGNGQHMRAEAATALSAMFAAAKTAGYTLVADSGYRSYSDQVAAYGSIEKAYGQAYADTVSARPGYSEHQTGWAVDIGITGGHCSLDVCFGDLPEGKWLAANSYRYGFILRYTEADSSTTGYSAEPWHFRYVGTLLSEQLHKENIPTLEQFFDVSGGAVYR